MKKLLLIMTLGVMVIALNACAFLDELIGPPEEESFQEIIMESRDHLIKTNVGLYVEDEGRGIFPGRSESRIGSGVVFYETDDLYYVLSSYHLIEATQNSEVTYEVRPFDHAEEETITAELLFYCEDADLALLAFDRSAAEMETVNITARYGDSLRRGEFVLAVGNPSGIDSVVTFGEYNRKVSIDRVEFEVIAHNAQIYPGNSGGLLADRHGNLIGINNWSSQSIEQSYAVGLDEIYEFLRGTEIPFTFLEGGS